MGRPEIDAHERLDIARLASDITERGHQPRASREVDAIVADLAQTSVPADTLLFMSNGGFGGIYQKIEAALSQRT